VSSGAESRDRVRNDVIQRVPINGASKQYFVTVAAKDDVSTSPAFMTLVPNLGAV
jgi:hypothetical protein